MVARLHDITRSCWVAAYAARAPPLVAAIVAGTIGGAPCCAGEICAAILGLVFSAVIASGGCMSIVW
jgi:hypothetical protein